MSECPAGPEMSHSSFKQITRFPGLDGIRCISITSVMYFHFAQADPLFGRLGVELFFIISGFLITTLLFREHEKVGKISLPNFWMRRVLRIFPIYFGFLIAQAFIVEVIDFDPAMVEDFKGNLVYFVTFTNNWFVHLSDEHPVIFYHAWSLATEEQFYLVWPVVLFLVRSPVGLAAVALALLLFDQVAACLVNFEVINLGINGNSAITSIATPICLGVLAAIAMNQRYYFERLVHVVGGFWSPLMLTGLTIALIVGDLPEILVHAAMTLFIISVVTQPNHAMSPIMSHPIIEFIGRISYGMYIMHMAAVNAVRILVFPDADPSSATVIAAGFALTVLASAISYQFYERPFLSLGQRFRSQELRST